MRRAHRFLVAGLGVPAAALAAAMWIGCSDQSSGPGGPGPGPDGEDPAGPTPEESSKIILSDPLGPPQGRAASGGGLSATFVSLPPGTFPDADSVVIRNLTADDGAELVLAVTDGGFDPVALMAEIGDRLEFELRGPAGVIGRKYGTVPRRKPPVIVRTAPPEGRTDVALGVRPTIVFSEPVDPSTLAGAVELRRGANGIEGQVAPHPTEPWVVEFTPSALLTPLTRYTLRIGATVRDSDGDGLESPASVWFTTDAFPSDPPTPAPAPTGTERIAFVSTRNGGPWIYLANADGSGVVPLVSGEAPAWSWDGTKIAFHRGLEVRVINSDGSGERRLVQNARFPAWAPGDERVAFQDDPLSPVESAIGIINADGTGRDVLVPGLNFNPWGYCCTDHLTTPAWAPDGETLAFVRDSMEYGGINRISRLYLVDADGSNLREQPFMVSQIERRLNNPAWSPEGSVLAFETIGVPDGGAAGAFDWVVATLDRVGDGASTLRYQGEPPISPLDPAGGADWSPDGSRLAFSAEYGGPVGGSGRRLRVFILDLETGNTQQLIPNATDSVANWAYDDYQVAWSRVSP